MSQTLFIGKNDEITDMLSLNLHLYLNTDVIKKEDMPSALELLKVHPNIDLILLSIANSEEEKGLSQFMRENKRKIPTIVLGEESMFFSTVKRELNPKPLLQNF